MAKEPQEEERLAMVAKVTDKRLREAADRMSPLSGKPYTSLDLALVRDAAYRASEQPEPEWEYAIRAYGGGGSWTLPETYESEEEARSRISRPNCVVVRRAKAGPWVLADSGRRTDAPQADWCIPCGTDHAELCPPEGL